MGFPSPFGDYSFSTGSKKWIADTAERFRPLSGIILSLRGTQEVMGNLCRVSVPFRGLFFLY